MGVGTHGGAVAPPADFVQLAGGTVGSPTNCPANCRGLLVGTAGTIDVTMENGQTRDGVPFPAGITPGRFAAVRASSAENIWAIV